MTDTPSSDLASPLPKCPVCDGPATSTSTGVTCSNIQCVLYLAAIMHESAWRALPRRCGGAEKLVERYHDATLAVERGILLVGSSPTDAECKKMDALVVEKKQAAAAMFACMAVVPPSGAGDKVDLAREKRIVCIDPDYRVEPKTDLFCCRCQKDMKPEQATNGVHLVDGAWEMAIHPRDAGAKDVVHPIGSDCAKKLPPEFIVGFVVAKSPAAPLPDVPYRDEIHPRRYDKEWTAKLRAPLPPVPPLTPEDADALIAAVRENADRTSRIIEERFDAALSALRARSNKTLSPSHRKAPAE